MKITQSNSSCIASAANNFFSRIIKSISDLFESICKSVRECCCGFKAEKVVKKSTTQTTTGVIYQQSIPPSSPTPTPPPPPTSSTTSPQTPPPKKTAPPPPPPPAPKVGWYFLEKNDYIKTYVEEHIHEGIFAGMNVKQETLPVNLEIYTITFKDLQAMKEEEQKRVIERCQLAPYVEKIDQFYEKLKKGNPKILGEIDLRQLVLLQINPYENSVLKYALLSDEELGKLTPNDIKGVRKCQRDVVSYRIKGGKIDPNFKGDISSTPLVEFHKIPGKQLTEWFKAGNKQGVYFVTEDQLKEIDLDQIPEDYLHDLFIQSTLSAEESKKRFALLSPEQVNKLLLKLDVSLIKLLSDEQIRKLDLTQIPTNDLRNFINRMFDCKDVERIVLLDQAQVQYIFPHIDGEQLKMLSNDHLSKLDFTRIDTKELRNLINRMFAYNHQERFAHLAQEQVQFMFPHLDGDKLKMLTNDHLSKLDFTKIDTRELSNLVNLMFAYNHQERFAHLAQKQVQFIFPHLDGDKLKMLSNAHLSKLDFTQIPTSDLRNLVNRMFDYSHKERFAQLSQAQVQFMFPHLDGEKLKLLSEDHLRNLNFTPVQKTEVHSLLNRMFTWSDRERFALLPVRQVQIILNEMDSSQLDLISEEQLAELDLSGMQKPHLKKKLEDKKKLK